MATNMPKQTDAGSPGVGKLAAHRLQREALRLATLPDQACDTGSLEAILARISAEVTADAARAVGRRRPG